MTYNHSQYITDTMKGFAMQETDSPYICCIIDDASTDGEQDVILEFINSNFAVDEQYETYRSETDKAITLLAQHNTNKNCFFYIIFSSKSYTI